MSQSVLCQVSKLALFDEVGPLSVFSVQAADSLWQLLSLEVDELLLKLVCCLTEVLFINLQNKAWELLDEEEDVLP